MRRSKGKQVFNIFIISICFLLLTALKSNSQITWEKTFGGGSLDAASSIQQTSDGGYIVAGATTSFGAGSYDFYIVKLDSNGSKLGVEKIKKYVH